MNSVTKQILCYALTPQIIPRVGNLLFSGFSHVAYFMAQIYHAARLLPDGHPYLSPANMGRFGVRHVIAQAAGNLVFSKEHIDQIAVFFLLLVGAVILILQAAMLGFAMFIPPAHAFGNPASFAAYFLVPNATHDVAFVILDRVFGVPDMFVDASRNPTCVVTGQQCFAIGQSSRVLTADTVVYNNYARTASIALNFPWPLHLAMQKMFEFYSVGLLAIAVFIFIYFIAAVVAETAQTGTAFGRRFNHVWAPLRIVAAMGALVPLTNGLNSTQYIVLWAAKWGSGFATNGWVYFNKMAVNGGDTLLGNSDTLVATPNAPPINTMLEFFTVVATCKHAYERMYYPIDGRSQVTIKAWLVNQQKLAAPLELDSTSFEDALTYFDKGDIIVRFGERRSQEHQSKDGGVSPFCGEMKLQVTDTDQIGVPGAFYILKSYYGLMWLLWRSAAGGGGSGCSFTTDDTGSSWATGCIGYNLVSRYLPIGNDPNAPLPTSDVLEEMRKTWQDYVQTAIDVGVTQQQGSPEWLESLSQLGWGGAAIWYNKVAQLNGALSGAAFSLPSITKYPSIMEAINKEKGMSDTDLPGASRHQLYRGVDRPVVLSDEEETQIAKALFAAQDIWGDFYTEAQPGGDVFMDVVNAIFGTAGLFNVQANADKHIHPLAQLVSIGRTVIDTAIRNLGYSAAAGLGGGIANLLGVHLVGRVAMAASGFISQLAMVGISIGFVLYYVVPFLPFIYFFFALGAWVKGIFEAMVGVPLWALAHIRIDGNGLPGDAALGGYYLILEVFLRPICIIFGFLASMTIFAAQAQVLHEIWPLVVSNATGFNVDAAQSFNVNQTGGMSYLRGAIDRFCFTVIYAIMIYMLGMSSFKLIDLVPNHILRWMGASISTFAEQSGDSADNIVRNTFIGSQIVGGQVSNAMGGARMAASHGSSAVQELFGRAKG